MLLENFAPFMRFYLSMRYNRVKQRTIADLSNLHKAKKMSDLHKGLSLACKSLHLTFVLGNFVKLFGHIICKYFTFLRSICLFIYAQINYKKNHILNLETRLKMVIWVLCRGYMHIFKMWSDRVIFILNKREITLAC